MRSDADDEVRGQRPAHVTCVGLAASDRVFQIDSLDNLSGSHKATESVQIDGGAAASAAVAISDLGGSASFVGCIGSGPVGDRVLIRLAEAGVNVEGAQRVDQATPVATVLIDRAGGWAEFTHIPADYFAESDPIAVSMADIDAVLVDCSWVEAASRTLSAARDAGIPGVANVNRAMTADELADVLKLATHVLFTRGALAAASGSTSAENGLRVIRSRTSAWIGVTKGTRGASWIGGHGLEHLAAFDVGLVDSFGAGDVFRGGFTLALAEGYSVRDAIRRATGAAAVACTYNGRCEGVVTRDEVEVLLASGPRHLV